MAKFSRLFFGSVIGAGLAYLFSRKDVRQRLMGGGRPQLPAAQDDHAGRATGFGEKLAPPPAAKAPAVTAEEPGMMAGEPGMMAGEPEVEMEAEAETRLDLESRIEATRQQVEAELEEPFTTAGPEAQAAEEIDTAEAPEALVEEHPVEVTEAADEPPSVDALEALNLESSAMSDSGDTAVEEAIAEEAIGGEAIGEEAIAEEAMDEAAGEAGPEEVPPAAAPAEAVIEQVDEIEEFADLRAPAEGEPTIETAPPVEAAPAPAAAGPAPSELDRDEMRRRIDETRARLKAKAFDAMVSGETFIEPESEGTADRKDQDAPTGLDQDTESQIDRSLTEED